MGLADIDLPTIEAAIVRLCRNARYFPTVAEIRAESTGIAGVDVGAEAMAAWGEVKRAVAAYGADGSPTWSSLAIAFAVDAIGWRDYCRSDVDSEASWRARFCDAFRGYRRAELDRLQVGDAPPRPRLDAPADRPALTGGPR